MDPKQTVVKAVKRVYGEGARVQGRTPPFRVFAKIDPRQEPPQPFLEGCQISGLKTPKDGVISFLVEPKVR